jgi:hypothetical protein
LIGGVLERVARNLLPPGLGTQFPRLRLGGNVKEVRRTTNAGSARLLALGALAAAFAAPAVVSAQPRAQDNRAANARAMDHALEVYVSDDALQALYVRTLDNVGQFGPADVRGGFFYNEDRDLILTGDMLTRLGDLDSPGAFEVRAGVRAYGAFLAIENEDVFGLGLGGEAEYFFSRDRRTSVSLSVFYSPDIVTFGRADDIKDATLRLNTELRDGTDIFVGFRAFEIDLPDEDREVDDNMHVGFRRRF